MALIMVLTFSITMFNIQTFTMSFKIWEGLKWSRASLGIVVRSSQWTWRHVNLSLWALSSNSLSKEIKNNKTRGLRSWPSENQKVTRPEESKLIPEHKNSKVNIQAQLKRVKVKKTERHTKLMNIYGVSLKTSQES